MTLLVNCADIHARCDDAKRRLCNRAFFTKVYIDEDDGLRVENNRPFEMLLASSAWPGGHDPWTPRPQTV